MSTDYLNKFVSSYGIKQICTANKSNNNNLFYLPLDHYVLSKFAQHVLPNINESFTLVSNDGDYYFDSNFVNSNFIEKILKMPNLKNWFIQNLYTDHVKLKHLPIGQDYHTLYLRPSGFNVDRIVTPFEQENIIENILLSSKKIEDRKLLAYCNWNLHLDRGDRTECFNSIEHSSCYFEPTRINRFETWKTQSEMSFVISPFGGGPDCHRTWEALSLGCIPILKRTPLSPVFEDLPCVFVDDWREVNLQFLSDSLTSVLNKKYNFSKMFLQYWKSQFEGDQSFNTNNMYAKSMKELYVA